MKKFYKKEEVKMEVGNLFNEVEKLNSLFVVQNGVAAKLVEEIFNAKTFTDLKAISYVLSSKFFWSENERF